MEVVSPGTITYRSVVFALSPLFFLLTGCVTSASYLAFDRPASDICRVVVAWNPEVIFTPDPVHNGQPTPGLAGRVYLFGSEVDYPRVGDGSIVVDLYKDSTAGKEADALPLMRRVKARFDPGGVCNPGIFVGGI